jgi:predicted small metal-binding protein
LSLGNPAIQNIVYKEVKMVEELRGTQLGIADCGFVAQGSPGEIVRRFVEHLRAEHEIDMPDVEEILKGKVGEDDVVKGKIDRGAWIVTQRLQEELDIRPPKSEEFWPPTG